MELISGEFFSGLPVALLPGNFNPPTIAHLGLAQAALGRVATVVFTLPVAFPHKRFDGVDHAARLALLQALTAHEPRFAVARTEGGLFLEIARELRELHPSAGEVHLLCGRDAAERIINWHYPAAHSLTTQLNEYRLLVAARQGEFDPPTEIRLCTERLFTESNWDEVSATEIRKSIQTGGAWRHLVPEQIHGHVEKLYGAG